MSRLTLKNSESKTYVLSKEMLELSEIVYKGEAVDKLAKFEDFYENLINDQTKLNEELDVLRNEGQNHSAHFRELFGQKMMINHILIRLKTYGLE